MVKHYDCSLARALRDVYPTIEMDDNKFADTIGIFYLLWLFYLIIFLLYLVFFVLIIFAGNHFHSVANRRKFFEDYAMKKGFNPLIADSWYLCYAKDFNSEIVFFLFFFYWFVLLFNLINYFILGRKTCAGQISRTTVPCFVFFIPWNTFHQRKVCEINCCIFN